MIDEQEKMYASFLDVMDDPLFPVADAKLRVGANIIPEDDTLYSFVNAAYSLLMHYYSKVYMTLCRSPEGVYFLQMQTRSKVPQRKMSELTMVIGLLMTLIDSDLTRIAENKNTSWVSIDTLLEELREKLSQERLQKLFGSRRGGATTQYDLNKIRDEVMKCLRDLQRKNFIRLNDEKTSYMTTQAIYRFIEPLRGISSETEIPQRIASLIQEGYLVQEEAEGSENGEASIEADATSDDEPLAEGDDWDLFADEEAQDNG